MGFFFFFPALRPFLFIAEQKEGKKKQQHYPWDQNLHAPDRKMELLCVQKWLKWPVSWAGLRARQRDGSLKKKKEEEKRPSRFHARLCAQNLNGAGLSHGGRTPTGIVRHNKAKVSAERRRVDPWCNARSFESSVASLKGLLWKEQFFHGFFFLLFAAPTKPPSSSVNPAFIASLQETKAGTLKL